MHAMISAALANLKLRLYDDVADHCLQRNQYFLISQKKPCKKLQGSYFLKRSFPGLLLQDFKRLHLIFGFEPEVIDTIGKC